MKKVYIQKPIGTDLIQLFAFRVEYNATAFPLVRYPSVRKGRVQELTENKKPHLAAFYTGRLNTQEKKENYGNF